MNLTLQQLQDLLLSHTEEMKDIKSDFSKAKELLASVDERLRKLCGVEEEKEEEKKPLRVWVKSVLNNANEPLTVKEIAELVLEAGYKTTSKQNFRNIVQQTILNDSEFRRKTKPKLRPARYAVEE